MIWKLVKDLLLFPIEWFWGRYQICKEENAVGKMICLFAFSLTGLAVIGTALVFLATFLINKAIEHPEILLVIFGIIWIYLWGRSRYLKGVQQKSQLIEQQEQDLQLQNDNAQKGLSAITMFMFSIFRNQSDEIDCKKPLTSSEIQMPAENYILDGNVCFYQFRLQKKDSSCSYDRATLDVFKRDIQYSIQTKLHSGETLPFEAKDIHDQYGNIYDAIVIDNIEDMGGYFQFSVVYASQYYVEFAQNRQMLQMQSSGSAVELSESWDNRQ